MLSSAFRSRNPSPVEVEGSDHVILIVITLLKYLNLMNGTFAKAPEKH